MKKDLKVIIIGVVGGFILQAPLKKLLVNLMPALDGNMIAIVLAEMMCVCIVYTAYKVVAALIKKSRRTEGIIQGKDGE